MRHNNLLVGLFALASLLLPFPGCFNSPDLDHLSCSKDRYCPHGYVCVGAEPRVPGKCQRPLDGGSGDVVVIADSSEARDSRSPDGRGPVDGPVSPVDGPPSVLDTSAAPDEQQAVEVLPVPDASEAPVSFDLAHDLGPDVLPTADTAADGPLGSPDFGPDRGPDLGRDVLPDPGSDSGADLSPDVPTTKPRGSACTNGSDCDDGFCVGNICCNRECSGACEECTAASGGVCSNKSGAQCLAATDCMNAAFCSGASASCPAPTPKAAGLPCGTSTCSGNSQVGPTCNGSGSCGTSTKDCAPYACVSGTCKTSCQGTDDCALGKVCQGSICGSCPGISQPCNGTCTDTTSDPNNCGSCGHKCTPAHCYSGNCVECLLPGDCPGAYFGCDTSTHACVCAQASSGNRLANPAFDKSLQLGSWGGQATGVSFSAEDADGCPGSGSARIGGTGAQMTQCLNLSGSFSFNFGFRFKDTGQCQVNVFSQAGCDLSYLTDSLAVLYGSSTTWSTRSTSGTTGSDTKSVSATCTGSMGDGYIDQIFLNTSGGSF